MMSSEREQGTVKMYSAERGFGFIERRSGEDVYVARSVVERSGLGTLLPGEQVSFTMRRTDRGLQAETLLRATAMAERAVGESATANNGNESEHGRLHAEYLRSGYFEERDSQASIRPELLDEQAISIAQMLGHSGMKSSQLRRYLSRARGIESIFTIDGSEQRLHANVNLLKRDVAYQVGRKQLPEPFQQFVNRNLEASGNDPERFRHGFIPHFESVVAYFTYYFREQ